MHRQVFYQFFQFHDTSSICYGKSMGQGVLIRADQSDERLLPWWHTHFREKSDLPVTILDCGLSPWGQAEAKKIGMVIKSCSEIASFETLSLKNDDHQKRFFDPLFRRQRFEPFTRDQIPQDCGIIIGCDQSQEQFLPFWYQNYRAFNDFPIAILDFGMSAKALKAAQKIGTIIPTYQDSFPQPLTKIADKPQKYYAEFVQKPCFLKVLNLHKTPFEKTIWLDTDCEVRGYLGDLFDLTDTPSGFASNIFKGHIQKSAKEKGIIASDEIYYASAAMAYTKNSPVIKAWQETTKNTEPFLGDDVTLSKAIHEHPFDVTPISEHYNRLYTDPTVICPSTKVIHFNGSEGKLALLREMIIDSTLRRET